MAWHRNAGGLWRCRPWDIGGRGNCSGGGGEGWDKRDLGDPYEHLRAASRCRFRHRGAEIAHADAADQGRDEGLLCGDGADDWPQYDEAEDQGHPSRRYLLYLGPESV